MVQHGRSEVVKNIHTTNAILLVSNEGHAGGGHHVDTEEQKLQTKVRKRMFGAIALGAFGVHLS